MGGGPSSEKPPISLLLLLWAGLALGAPAHAEAPPQEQLKSVEKAIEESRQKQATYAAAAEALAAELAQLRSDSVTAAAAAQAHEAALSELEERLAALTAEAALKASDLRRHQAQQTQLLMALERLARHPPEGLALSPEAPVDAVRSALLLGAAVPPIEARARALRTEIATLAALRQEITQAQARHRDEHNDLTAAQARIAEVIAKKAALQQHATREAEESGRRLRKLAAEATDLHELIERLEAPPPPHDREVEVKAPPPIHLDPAKPKAIRPFTQARGRMVFPATGLLLRRFGENDELGMASKGLTLRTRGGAQVIAPFDGRVMFAGPFRGYGQILIIEHGDGYHSLLAGLERVDGAVGQWLVAGEPVGTMPVGEAEPRLYLELRHNGQPINPLPWLATRDEKVSG